MSRHAGVLLCLVLSGAAALVYETVWLRQLSVVLGTTELAAAVVLAAYMGGLALGSTLGGRLAGRLRHPLRVYGLLELGIAATAALVPTLLSGARALRDTWLGGLVELPTGGGTRSALVFAALALLVLSGPTVLLGATLPVVVRASVRSTAEVGARVGALYAANTAGAVCGVLAAGFWLIPDLGLLATTHAAMAINVGVCLLAVALDRRADPREPAPRDVPDAAPTDEDHGAGRRVLPLVLVASAAAFVEEILWTRLLAHLVGGSLRAFATMLAAFLLGIALGGAVGARLARDRAAAGRWFLVSQAGAAVCALAAFLAAPGLRQAAEYLGAGAGGTLPANAAVALAALLPLTFFVGLSFPCAVRLVARDADAAAGATGRVYACSTLGAIAGALAAGFVLLPELGSGGTARCAVALHAAAALGAVALGGFGARARVIAGAGLIVALVLPLSTPLSLLLASPFESLAARPAESRVVFAAEGRAASVVLLEQDGVWRLRTNGHPEAEIVPPGRPPHGEHLQGWLTTLPILARPELERMLVVGLGGGVSLEDLPPAVARVDVIELEAQVVAANRAVADLRDRDPLADPRVKLVVNDARGALARTEARWDAIVSQPSHPWTAGSSHLYTREFLELAREHLEPDGVFVQWIGTVFLDDGLLADLAATLLEVFEQVRVYRPKAATLVLLASDAPLEPERVFAERSWSEQERAYLARLGLVRVEDLASALALEQREVELVAAAGRPLSDDRNPLAFARVGAGGAIDAPLGSHDPLRTPGSAWVGGGPPFDPVLLAERLAQRGFGGRARALVGTLTDPRAQTLAAARVHRVLGEGEQVLEQANEALLLDETDGEARFLLLESRLGEVAAGAAPPEWMRMAADLGDPAAAVLEGTGHVQRGEWQALEALDARLALATPRHAAYSGAVRLRATWRSADAARPDRVRLGREALALLDEALAWDPDPHGLLLRVDAAMAAGQPLVALETARVLMRWLEPDAPPLPEATADLIARTVAALLDPRGPLEDDPRIPADRLRNLRLRAVRIGRG